MIKVVLFDDEPVILEGLRATLSSHTTSKLWGRGY